MDVGQIASTAFSNCLLVTLFQYALGISEFIGRDKEVINYCGQSDTWHSVTRASVISI